MTPTRQADNIKAAQAGGSFYGLDGTYYDPQTPGRDTALAGLQQGFTDPGPAKNTVAGPSGGQQAPPAALSPVVAPPAPVVTAPPPSTATAPPTPVPAAPAPTPPTPAPASKPSPAIEPTEPVANSGTPSPSAGAPISNNASPSTGVSSGAPQVSDAQMQSAQSSLGGTPTSSYGAPAPTPSTPPSPSSQSSAPAALASSAVPPIQGGWGGSSGGQGNQGQFGADYSGDASFSDPRWQGQHGGSAQPSQPAAPDTSPPWAGPTPVSDAFTYTPGYDAPLTTSATSSTSSAFDAQNLLPGTDPSQMTPASAGSTPPPVQSTTPMPGQPGYAGPGIG